MVETAVYDKTIFDAKREGLGIRIKKSQGAWRTISFPESQHITSFKVINRGGNDNIVNFNSIPYTSTTGYPKTLSIGADADNLRTKLFTKGLGGEKSGVPGIINFNKLRVESIKSRFPEKKIRAQRGRKKKKNGIELCKNRVNSIK